MVTWQWLSYSRYFREDEYAPLSMEPASYSDYTDSGMFAFLFFFNTYFTLTFPIGSFMVVSRVNTLTDMWFRHPHLHRGFHPTSADLARFPNSNNIVTDPLLACPHQMDPREMRKHWYPEVRLYNFLMARDGRPPRPITELRPYKPEIYNISVDFEKENTEGSKMRKKSSTQQVVKRKYITFPDEGSETRSAAGSAHNSLLVPWRLRPTTSPWPTKREPWLRSQYRTGICNVAISPRGARWIVGVGEGMSIFIWRMKD